MPQIVNQFPFQSINTGISSPQRYFSTMIPPSSEKKAKTNFSMDWIMHHHNEEPSTRPSLPKDYDSEICSALRMPLPHSPTTTKSPSPGHTIESQQTCLSNESNHLPQYEDRYHDRITPEASVNDVLIPPTHIRAPPHSVPASAPQMHHHSHHQRPAPYRPIPFTHNNYPHGGPTNSSQGGGVGPIRTGGSAGGMNDSDLVVAQLQFIAAMSYRQQQHQFANMQHPSSGLHGPAGHPHTGMPPSSLMYAQGHLAPPHHQFHNDAVAYPLAPWLINRHGRLMARPFSHGTRDVLPFE